MTAADAIVPTLRVCNCAGGVISETRLDTAVQAPGTASERGRLVTMGWTDGEMLVMVRERGGVEVRDIMVSAWCQLVLDFRHSASRSCSTAACNRNAVPLIMLP